MAIRLRNMTEDDYLALGTEVRTAPGKDSHNTMEDALDSIKLFGDFSSGIRTRKDYKRDNKRAYIKLTQPTFNYVLSQSGALLQRMLDIPKRIMTGLMNYTLVWSIEEENFIKVSELTIGDKFICGAAYIKKRIDDFDIDEELKFEIEGCISDSKVFKKDVDMHRVIQLIRTKNPPAEATLVVEDFYAVVFDGVDINDVLNKDKTLDDIRVYITEKIFKTHTSRLSYLLNLEDKTPLYGMLNFRISVIPPGLRPKSDTGIDKLTKAYTKIIHCNQRLMLSSDTIEPSAYVDQYRELDYATCSLQYVRKNKYDTYKGPVTITERVKSKKGQIRQNNLGKRIDYSGRSTVIVNPYLSIEKIKIPKTMAVKIFKFHLLPYLNGKKIYSSSPKDVEYMINLLKSKGILQRVPVVLGRQPTLHKQSLQGFFTDVTDSEAIEVPALVCPAFNMDFDGDTGHDHAPLSEEAIKEVSDIILTSQNIFLEKSGKCTIVPRQDMLYGLYFCTRSNYSLSKAVADFPNYSEVLDGVCCHRIKVWDTVKLKGKDVIAGYAAFQACFPKPEKVEVKEITGNNIIEYTEYLLDNHNLRSFISATDKLVQLGFKVARSYSQSLSLLGDRVSIPEYDNALEEFHKGTKESEYLYSIGLEDNPTYNLEYGKSIDALKSSTEKYVSEKLGNDSGYRIMSDSGARGNKSNLNQMFSYKGRIAASSTETINVLLENSYEKGLLPIEGLIAAYGGRKGLMDKSLKTADTGYFSRLLWHTTQGWVITNADCGTTEGLTIRKIDLAQFFPTEEEREDVMIKFLEGRYEAGTNMYINKKRAIELTKTRDSVVIRSPIKCKNPCCQKCYGMSNGNHKDVAIGTAIGLIAAQSIGEPSTQITMKQFQKGGVAGNSDITSSFDRLNDYVNIRDLVSKQRKGDATSYEPIAWISGKTIVTTKGNVKIVGIEGSKVKIQVPNKAIISPYVEKGRGIYAGNVHGDYYLREIESISGVDAAKTYLIMQMFNLYKSECIISLKHFEVLAAAMTQYMIISTDRDDLKVGQYCDRIRLLKKEGRVVYKEMLLGVKKIPETSLDAMATIQLEDPVAGFARCALLGLSDNLDNPIQRMVFGLKPKLGTSYGYEYTSERRIV